MVQPVGVDSIRLRGAFTVSENGVLAHRLAGSPRRQLVWADRTGRILGALSSPDDTGLANPGMGPDGRVAASRNPQNNADVWIVDLMTGASNRLTFDPATDGNALWSPDGNQIIWQSQRGGDGVLPEHVAAVDKHYQPRTSTMSFQILRTSRS